jgi:hypothetical protein
MSVREHRLIKWSAQLSLFKYELDSKSKSLRDIGATLQSSSHSLVDRPCVTARQLCSTTTVHHSLLRSLISLSGIFQSLGSKCNPNAWAIPTSEHASDHANGVSTATGSKVLVFSRKRHVCTVARLGKCSSFCKHEYAICQSFCVSGFE